MAQPPHREPVEPAGGVGTPADEAGHLGSYTVPSDVMDQSSPGSGRDRLNQRGSTSKAGFPWIGVLLVVLVVLFIAWLTLRAGM